MAGDGISVSFRVVIPARYAATRLPGKPLVDIGGKSMVQYVYDRAVESGALHVIVATDDDRVIAACRKFGAESRMTSEEHASGTDRVAEVCVLEGWSAADVVVNLQADEPLMPPSLIRQVAGLLEDFEESEMATLACPVQTMDEYSNPNVVKLVRDTEGNALYFSRAPIPFDRDAQRSSSAGRCQDALRHLGIYSYRVATLLKLSSAAPCRIEEIEKLEQLRALWNGIRIRVGMTEEPPGPGVDSEDDLKEVRHIIESRSG